MQTPYSAEKEDLYYPANRAAFFPNGRPKSDAALCVEIARLAYCEIGRVTEGRSFAFDQARIGKILGRVQFTDCKFFESAINPTERGSHALLAIDKSQQLAVLGFRGTDKDDPTDLFDDFSAIPVPWQKGGKVHSGFANALMALQPEIQNELNKLNGYTLLLTGHSLGAAMATLAATLLPAKALYTFGSPRVGDKEFLDQLPNYLDNFRYVDCCDIVTRIPPSDIWGYEHIPGNIYYIDSDREVRNISPDNPYIAKDRMDAEAKYLLDYAWRIGDVATRALADHAPVNYVLPVTSATP